MTQIPKRRRKKRRFYWVELGFLILGLIGLRPEILTELFPNNRPRPTANFYSPVYNPAQTLHPANNGYDPSGQPLLSYSYPQAYAAAAWSNPSWNAYSSPYPPQAQPNSPYRPDPNLYDPNRIASNPAQMTSRYAANPAYPSPYSSGYPQNAYPSQPAGQSPAGTSQPPVAWPDGYQPNNSTYYRR
ncbi:MAG: hypothetical protein NTV29_08725 [Planctomycetota bacterium]|jgi:hypothetical protein|nr:hypothetical protein [Planctomycetota bacterium]